MNTLMLKHSSMQTHLTVLRSFGYHFIDSAVKNLACGETGGGALASVETIVSTLRSLTESIGNLYSEERIAEKTSACRVVTVIIEEAGREDVPAPPDGVNWCRHPVMMSLSGVFSGFALGVIVAFIWQRKSQM
jgi:hypothetical protein